MKNTILVTLLCGILSINVAVADSVDESFWFPNETFDHTQVGESSITDVDMNQVKAITNNEDAVFVADNQRRFRRNFLSRRPYLAPTNNKQAPEQYAANESWQGATEVRDQPFDKSLENTTKERKSNIRFFSRRPYMNR